jgi:hypothetical protein
MQLPAFLEGPSLTRLLQGAAFGALATIVIGFNWGGWMLESNARQMATKETSSALVAVLAPMCADKFRGAREAALNTAEFKKVSTWQQDSFIQKGGWASFPGMSSPDIAIAQGCADLLAKASKD